MRRLANPLAGADGVLAEQAAHLKHYIEAAHP